MVHVAVDLYAAVDALALAFHGRTEIHPSHIFHQNMQLVSGLRVRGHLPLLQKLPVIEVQQSFPFQENACPVICPVQADFFQPALIGQR